MQTLLDSPAPLVFAPWEVSSHVWIDETDLDRLAASGERGAWVAEHTRPWLRIWREDLGAPGFNPFDTLAIAALTHPDWLDRFACRVWIEDGPDDTAPRAEQARGATKPHLLVAPARRGDGRIAAYCHRPSPAFKPMLLERLAGPAT
jgi:pyrimidine-specific ribonucleoside hydrolase